MKLVNVSVLFATLTFLSGCAIAGGGYKDEPRVEEEEYLPFFIAIKADGTPVIKGYDGEIYEGREASFPIKSTRIESFQTISYVKYRGSCKIVMDLNGKKFEYVLPDSYCEQF